MTYSDTTRALSDISNVQRIAAVLDYYPATAVPGLAHTVPEGAKYAYPPLLQYLVCVCARLFGSERKALRELSAPGVWEQVGSWYSALIGIPVSLPNRPPTAKEQDAFVRRMTKDVQALRTLEWDLGEAAIGQGHLQGQFQSETKADFANPDRRNIIFGDGTWQSAYSRAAHVYDKSGAYVSSIRTRAKSPERVRAQRVRDTGKKDGKNYDGINNVFFGTWTDHGRIVLACAQTTGSEQVAALDLLDRLATRLRDRLHVLVYDKAITGWPVHDVLAKHGVLVVTKPVARAEGTRVSDGYRANRLAITLAKSYAREGMELPLGTSVYFSSKERKNAHDNGYEVMRTKFHKVTRRIPEVDLCPAEHELWVDGGELVDAPPRPDGHRYKRTTARATSAKPQGALSGLQEVPIHWELRCAHASGGSHKFHTLWEPKVGKRQRPARGTNRAEYDLRPLGLSDRRFWHATGLRNNAESLNAWFKASFNHTGRAMRLDVDAQFLDQLASATAVNALTWFNFNEYQRLTGGTNYSQSRY